MASIGRQDVCCVMVGLPARGKTFISRKLSRYLSWLSIPCKVFNVGDYRRKLHAGTDEIIDHTFFDPNNRYASDLRQSAAEEALEDMVSWFNFQPNETRQDCATDSQADGIFSAGNVESNNSDSSISYDDIPDFVENSTVKVAIYDATNSTVSRRKQILQKCQAHNIQVMFIEIITNDEEMIMSNIREVKLSSPDYTEFEAAKAVADFKERIRHYEEAYETVDGPNSRHSESDLCYVKLIDVGSQVIINLIHGYLQSRVVYYLMNLQIAPRSIYLCRHGESMFNVQGKIGGDADLSPRGLQFAKALPDLLKKIIDDESVHSKLTVWTSTLKRTISTAQYLDYPKLNWKALDEIDAGVCDGMTYEEIEEQFPEDFAERDNDKYHYRYRGGESYKDLVLRLEPIIMELERQQHILVIGHQAVLRAIYSYFLNLPQENLPYIHIPLHTVVKLTPKAYKCEEQFFKANIEAVDTHRPKPTNLADESEWKRSSYGDRPVKIVGESHHKRSPNTSPLAKSLNYDDFLEQDQ